MIEFKNIDKTDTELVDKIYESMKELDLVEVRKILREMFDTNKGLIEEQAMLLIPTLVLESEEDEEDEEDKDKVKENEEDDENVEENDDDDDDDEDEELEESDLYHAIKESIEALVESSSNDNKPNDDPTKKPKPEGSGDGKGKGTKDPKKEPKNDEKKGTGSTSTKTKSSPDGSTQIPFAKDVKDEIKDKDDHIKKKG